MTASAARLLAGSPDPHGRALFHVSALSRESAWRMVVDAPQYERAEVVYFDERGAKTKAYRDATTRQWRTK